MKVGVLGTGDVGKALSRGFVALGHEVTMGAREAGNPKAAAFAQEMAGKVTAGTFAEAARFGEVVVLATLGVVNAEVIAAAGPENLAGKLLIDTTNPLDFSKGFPPSLARPDGASGGEQVQRLAPQAKVVKAWSSVGNALMFKPQLPGGPPTMFICGDDAAAKAQTTRLLSDFGWETLDAGGIAVSGAIEALAIVWVLTAASTNSWVQAFKMLRP